MKKIMVMGLMAVLGMGIMSPKEVRADGTLTILKDYGIPCVLAVGLSAALVKNDGAAVGAAICVAVTSATLLNKKVVDNETLQTKVDDAVAQRDIKITGDIDTKLAKMDEKQKEDTEETRKILREILAERLASMDTDIRDNLQKQMQNNSFFPELERKINSKIKEEVIIEGRARNREVINECVDEVINKVVAKPIAVPDNGGGAATQ